MGVSSSLLTGASPQPFEALLDDDVAETVFVAIKESRITVLRCLWAIVADISTSIAVSVGLVAILGIRTIVTRIADIVTVNIGLLQIGNEWAIVSRIDDAVLIGVYNRYDALAQRFEFGTCIREEFDGLVTRFVTTNLLSK